jgi:hypothetical protein
VIEGAVDDKPVTIGAIVVSIRRNIVEVLHALATIRHDAVLGVPIKMNRVAHPGCKVDG